MTIVDLEIWRSARCIQTWSVCSTKISPHDSNSICSSLSARFVAKFQWQLLRHSDFWPWTARPTPSRTQHSLKCCCSVLRVLAAEWLCCERRPASDRSAGRTRAKSDQYPQNKRVHVMKYSFNILVGLFLNFESHLIFVHMPILKINL